MAVSIEIIDSEDQIISGFPEYVILTVSDPSYTLFYTLDGTDPDENSEMFVDKIVIPTTGLTTELRVIAIGAPGSTGIISQTYFTLQQDIEKSRLTRKEGVNTLPYGKVPVDHLSYDSEGNQSQQTYIPFQKLDMIGSTADYQGQDISGDTTLDFVNFGSRTASEKVPTISNTNQINFDPRSSYIVIDGFTQEEQDRQVVRIINRSNNTMDLVSPSYARNQSNYQLNTSSLVRYMINPKTGKITFYYRESRENRWIVSNQKTEPKTLNLTPTAGPPNSFVFRWIENRAQSKIY